MSERERWIVYPLIFFALGAAIRDKLTQRVQAKQIACESLHIVDLHNPSQPLVEFSFLRGSTTDESKSPISVGVMRLSDSEGNIYCLIKEDAAFEFLSAEAVQTREVQVVDPHDHALVKMATEAVVPKEEEADTASTKRFFQGVLYLNNERLMSAMRVAVPEQQPASPEIEQPKTVSPSK